MSPVQIHAGFIPLVDCAPLVIAKEMGFDTSEGIELVLHREVSWANIRDRVEAGAFDCAIMLAPMPLAATLGLGGRPPVAMVVPMATSLNGNAITVSRALFADMLASDEAAAVAGGMAPGRALARVVEQRAAKGLDPLTLGMVYPFSSHNYDLRYFLAAAGIDPDNDVNIVVVPPPLIAASLKAGRVDGFCVGEPWNSVAVAEGDGVIVAEKCELWASSPEKVLALREDDARNNPERVQALVRALVKACAWADEPANRTECSRLLAEPHYVGAPQEIISRSLIGRLDRGDARIAAGPGDVVIFHKGHANVPRLSHAIWMLTQMVRWGQVRAPFDFARVARAVYRLDLYRAVAGTMALDIPESEMKAEGSGTFFGEESFDPAEPLAYLRRLPMCRTDLKGFTERA